MQQHENSIVNTLTFFQKAVPDPQERNFTTQLGVHFEEVGEGLDALTFISNNGQLLLDRAKTAIKALARELKNGTADIILMNQDREEFLDALCDQIVTATGTAHMARMDIIGGLNEVNRSNLSKFDDNGEPIFNEHLKVMKGPNYTQAELKPFV